jgi:hypothetical protein
MSQGRPQAAVFVTGQAVRTLDTVLPIRFAGQAGTVVAAVGDEISVRLGSPDSHSLSIAFRRREIAAIEVGQTLCSGPRSLGSAIPDGREPLSQK